MDRMVSETAARPRNGRAWIVATLVLTALTAVALLLMGRVPICTCGTVKLFVAEVNSSDNSQHLSDWYTPSHIIHGFLFYGLTWLVARNWPMGKRLFAATVIEVAWELLENSPIVIDRYRTATMAVGYMGDSVINSVADIVAMAAGFWLASRLPVWATVVLALVLEVLAAWVIRDNLTLNVVMLLWPVEAIKVWQAGG